MRKEKGNNSGVGNTFSGFFIGLAALPQAVVPFIGLTLLDEEALVDTNAQSGVIGKRAAQALYRALRRHGLRWLWVDGAEQMANGVGVGRPEEERQLGDDAAPM